MKVFGVVYGIVAADGRVYVGQTQQPERRRKGHAQRFPRARFVILSTVYWIRGYTRQGMQRVLDAHEAMAISFQASHLPHVGYNQTTGGKAAYFITPQYSRTLSTARIRHTYLGLSAEQWAARMGCSVTTAYRDMRETPWYLHRFLSH